MFFLYLAPLVSLYPNISTASFAHVFWPGKERFSPWANYSFLPSRQLSQQRISGADSLPHLFRNSDDVSKWPVDSDEPEVMSDVSSTGASTDRKKHKSKRIETQILLQSRGKKGNALCEGCLVRKNAQQM